MAAYCIIRVDVHDREQYRKYLDVTPKILRRYGGRAIVRAGETVTLEGPEEKRRMVVIEFPSIEKAREWYNSPEYREAKKLREGAATGEIIVVEGVQ